MNVMMIMTKKTIYKSDKIVMQNRHRIFYSGTAARRLVNLTNGNAEILAVMRIDGCGVM